MNSFLLDEIKQIKPTTDTIKQMVNMIYVEPKSLERGSDLEPFWMDEIEVTNQQFQQFIEETNYITTSERYIVIVNAGDSLIFPPGAMKFVAKSPNWWEYKNDVNWTTNKTLSDYGKLPVVNVSWYDALAFCQWAGKELPSQKQWEFVAEHGRNFDYTDIDNHANVWQGVFPMKNTISDGFEGVAPVRSFASNKYGFYDLEGNVWEWCNNVNLANAKSLSYETLVNEKLAILKGGSYLCHHSYCSGYVLQTTMDTTPDSSFEHVGFRCVRNLTIKNK